MPASITRANDFIGKKVKLVFDRPFGSKHPRYDFIYELNYGYVPNTLSPDGKELDAYYLSEKIPLANVEGICIAVAHRKDDDDDKLIVVKKDENYSDKDILNLISFQEKYFDTEIIR